MVDQYGNNTNFTFLHEDNSFIGYVDFSNNDGGMFTFYAQVRDEVHNTSEIVSRTIRIISGEPLILSIDDSDRNLKITDITRNPNDNTTQRDVIDDVKNRKLYDITSDRKLVTRSSEVK